MRHLRTARLSTLLALLSTTRPATPDTAPESAKPTAHTDLLLHDIWEAPAVDLSTR